MQLSPRERVLRAINHQVVDRVPIGLFGTHPDYEDALVRHVHASSREDMYRKLGIDVWHCRNGLQYVGERPQGLPFWGTVPAFDSVDDVEAFAWPSIDHYSSERLAREIAEHKGEFAVVGGINSAVFHHFLWICGQENGLACMALMPDVAEAVIRHITDFFVDYLKKVLEAGRGGVDIIENCNDFGTQRGLFISAEMFRRFLRPSLQRLYDVTKDYGAKVMQHSCGSIVEIIPDFIEMGADILNPIQVAADGMAIEGLAARFKNQITFYGGIDTQHLLPDGPPEEIRRQTRRVITLFGPGGGYILSGSQGLLEDIPVEHSVAMFEEGLKGF